MVVLLFLIGVYFVPFSYSQHSELQTTFYTTKGTTDVLRAATTTYDNIDNNNNNDNIDDDFLSNPVNKAIKWLITQRESDWGWRNDTPKILIVLKLLQNDPLILKKTITTNLLPQQLEFELSIKQLEIETVILLWRHHEIPIIPPKLSIYTLALNTLCHDPRQFHGHDLIGTLQHHNDNIIHDLDFSLSILSICSSHGHIRKKQIRRLLDIANTAKDHNIDTVAMTILALKCIIKDHRHRNLQHSLRRPSISLARQQQPDGGFGNLFNTALTIQALHEMNEINSYWNRTAARSYIETRQDPDGAFTDPGLTADVLLALTSRGGLNAIRNLDCNKNNGDIENHVEIDLTKSLMNHGNDSEIRNVTITYTLWIGTNITENCTIYITAPRNTSFYNIMQIAMELDTHFTFEASEWPNGHYVHTLAGYKEEPMGYHYWLLYRLPELPDPSAPPANQLVAPVGVDDLLIEEGDHYLFWYKKL